jgi:hypothetical protein
MPNDSDSLDVYSVVDLNIHKVILYSSDQIKVHKIKTLQFCIYTNNDENNNYIEQYSSNMHDYNTIKYKINEKLQIICCLDWYIRIKIIINFNNTNGNKYNDDINILNKSFTITSDRIMIRNLNRYIIPLLSINQKPIGKIILSMEFQYNYNSFKYLVLCYKKNEQLPYIIINDLLLCIKDHCINNISRCSNSNIIINDDDECDDIRYDRNECIIDSNHNESFINNDDNINDDATSSITTINIYNEIPYDNYHLNKNKNVSSDNLKINLNNLSITHINNNNNHHVDKYNDTSIYNNNDISNINDSMNLLYSYDKNIFNLTTAIDEFTILLTDQLLFDHLLFKSLNSSRKHYINNENYDNISNISINNDQLRSTANKISSYSNISNSCSLSMKYFPYHKAVLGVRNIINDLIGPMIQVRYHLLTATAMKPLHKLYYICICKLIYN